MTHARSFRSRSTVLLLGLFVPLGGGCSSGPSTLAIEDVPSALGDAICTQLVECAQARSSGGISQLMLSESFVERCPQLIGLDLGNLDYLIEAAVRRGVRVRIVSDDDKSEDLGSDVDRLRAAGAQVVLDASEAHMHHKFAVFDGQQLVTGSFNWTRSASEVNAENLVVTDDPRLVGAFANEFERLWQRLGDLRPDGSRTDFR